MRRSFLFVIVAGLFVAAVVVFEFQDYRRAKFLRELCLVKYGTHMIGTPYPEQELAARERAEQLGIDLFAAYRDSRSDDVRCQLAWLLISDESPEYYRFVQRNIESACWLEARVWASRIKKETVSPEYRERLLELLQASPTAEAKLAVALWHDRHDRRTEAEDAYYVALTSGSFWHALPAAKELLESDRYRSEAVDQLLLMVREADVFQSGPAYSLLDHYNMREELVPLVERCASEPKNKEVRVELVEKLTELVEQPRASTDAD
jgi:hypothetical protein